MSGTIVALATPNGRSGIGVVRLSGPDATVILNKITSQNTPEARKAHLAKLIDPKTSESIDEAIFTFFKAPNSFTGEDVVEISCHGSPVLLREVIDICLSLDARMAEPGEFTLQAVANGRIGLSEAEAIRDLIDAQTAVSARQAVRQMQGALSHELQPLKNDLLNVIVILESALEFVEDDLPVAQLDKVKETLLTIAAEADRLAGTYKAGHLLRDGLRVAIVGRPNVGKSSLFNRLLGSDRAIVTDIAGTTRDQLHERFVIDGIPISLVDTAGLRETNDAVESIGVERAKGVMADADLVIVLLDSSVQIADEDREILSGVQDLNYIVALNKIDMVPSTDIDRIAAAEYSSLSHLRERLTPISAKTGEGLDELRLAIIGPFGGDDLSNSGFLITDARHYDLLLRTVADIRSSLDQLDQKMSEEIVLVGLHNALKYLGEVTGETTTEDVLSQIFATFCIGK